MSPIAMRYFGGATDFLQYLQIQVLQVSNRPFGQLVFIRMPCSAVNFPIP